MTFNSMPQGQMENPVLLFIAGFEANILGSEMEAMLMSRSYPVGNFNYRHSGDGGIFFSNI